MATTTSASINTGANTIKYIFKTNLEQGMSGDEVKNLQNFLIENGYMTVAANGNYGPATKSGVMKFQSANRIKATGSF